MCVFGKLNTNKIKNNVYSKKIFVENVSNEHGLMRTEMCKYIVINSLQAFKTFNRLLSCEWGKWIITTRNKIISWGVEQKQYVFFCSAPQGKYWSFLESHLNLYCICYISRNFIIISWWATSSGLWRFRRYKKVFYVYEIFIPICYYTCYKCNC